MASNGQLKDRGLQPTLTDSRGAESDHCVGTLAGATPNNLGRSRSSGFPASSNKAPPRIVDASPSFDFDELAGFRVPSTIPGNLEDSSRVGHHRTPQTPEPGQRVGRYLTEEVLGRGGMGLVLRARDDLLQREVAIKVILPEYLSSDPAAGLRFLREAEIVARLDHPNIIRVLDAGLDAGVAYLTFEYVHGKTFSAVRDEGLTTPSSAVDLILPVLSAVARAHQLGVVHGDLKPTNLILGEDHAGRAHPWVLDFGVSFFSDVDAGLDPMRRRVSGTPGYLAPEWLNGKGVDGRADCFSLGCVLYELIARKPPFAGITRLSQAVAAAKERSYPALSHVSSATKELQAVVERALDPNPETRFSNIQEMARATLPFATPTVRSYYEAEFSLNERKNVPVQE